MNRQNTREVCPWNSQQLVQATREVDYLARVPGLSEPEPGRGEAPAHAQWTAYRLTLPRRAPVHDTGGVGSVDTGSAIRRAGYEGFKRNVAVAMGNWLASVDEPPEEAAAVLCRRCG